MTADTLNLIGRMCVVFYFLWATWFNFKAWNHHISEFKRVGVALAGPALAIGLVMQLVGSILLLVPGMVVIGGVILIVFTAGADLLFHRFWTYTDPNEQVLHKFFLFEHIALIGGLLGLMSMHL